MARRKHRRRRRLLGLLVLAALAAAGAAAAVYAAVVRQIAHIDAAAVQDYRPKQVTKIFSADGRRIGEIFEERRTVVSYAEIPSHVENAFLAAEDADFYRHEGLDWWGIARAAVANLRAGAVRQGASTITQQVVKIFLLSSERTFRRKLQELVLARRIEQTVPKQKILELYLNQIYLGHGCYGVEEASWYYFGKSVRDIDLGQAAILAGLPKAPSRDSPIDNPEGAKKRQVYVLRQMVARGWARPDEAERFIEAPLDVVDRRTVPRVVPGAEPFVDAVHALLLERYGKEALSRLGASVHTTVDLSLQAVARRALRSGLRAVDARHRYGRNLEPAGPKAIERARARARGKVAPGARLPMVVRAVHDGGGLRGIEGDVGDLRCFAPVPAGSRYDEPKRPLAEAFPAGAITTVTIDRTAAEDGPAPCRARIDAGPEGAVVVLDVATGAVRAMVGGYEDVRGGFHRATAARRQPGSAFKPFVYGAALESRRFTPATIVEDSPEIYEKWRPTNFRVDVYRGPIRLREAIAHSVNTVAIKVLDAVGIETVVDFARRAGITSPLGADLSLALGTSEVTPLELAGAYGTIARGGLRVAPFFVRSIEVPGEAARDETPAGERTIDPAVAYVLTSMMTSVVEEGTARRARRLHRPLAGKTGTSAKNRDAWFAAFTPRTVAVAWVGFDTPRSLGRGETGGRAALPVVVETLAAAEDGLAPEPFVPPPGVEVRRIDRATGLLAPPDAPAEATLEEVFLAGTAPEEEAPPPGAASPDDLLLDLYGAPDGAPAPPEGAAPPPAAVPDEP